MSHSGSTPTLGELSLAITSLDQPVAGGEEPQIVRQTSSELGITPDRARELEQRGLRLLTTDAALHVQPGRLGDRAVR